MTIIGTLPYRPQQVRLNDDAVVPPYEGAEGEAMMADELGAHVRGIDPVRECCVQTLLGAYNGERC